MKDIVRKFSKVLFYFAILCIVFPDGYQSGLISDNETPENKFYFKTTTEPQINVENWSEVKVYFQNKVENLSIPGYLSTPRNIVKGQEYSAVVLAHGCSGAFSYSNPYSGLMSLFKRWMQILKSRNYVVLLVDSFSPRADGQNQCGNGSAGTSEVSQRPNDINAAFDFLTKEFNGDILIGKVALFGWSHGGSTTLTSLDSIYPQNFEVGISYYPGCGFHNDLGGIRSSTWKPYADIYIFHAGLDQLYTSGYCDDRINQARELLMQSGSDVRIEMTIYPGTHHSFDLATKPTSKFNLKDVEARSVTEKKVLEILDKYLS